MIKRQGVAPHVVKTGSGKKPLQEIVLLLLGSIRYTGSGLCTLTLLRERRRGVCLCGGVRGVCACVRGWHSGAVA